ncbi:transglutaminase domain-containing protein [Cohnella sp. CFH 77786]|uniref:transglutaminase domain-containing protein n=1 Tax=Cohnella sp. CFH 77786 TaxID=2662265 RepID=UPI001C608B59|nr:transglutaminase-like domain-containing protein [Cohnella sp. CFH 77786]MBW5447264.1 transglutaminase domain-containing protein [Cohnella sp. CFH 77786]
MSGRSAWSFIDTNPVTVVLLAIVALSLLQGVRRGASGSARQLFHFLIHSVVTVGAVAVSAYAASSFSGDVQAWLSVHGMARPSPDANTFKQLSYAVVSGLRDLPLFRFAALFLLVYTMIRLVTGVLAGWFAAFGSAPFAIMPSGGVLGRTAGGAIGAAIGSVRALLLTAVLFGYCALFPHGPYTGDIQQSALYREVAAQVIRPAAGPLLERRLPVFARQMTGELDQLWQRRYDVIDAELPGDIVRAAQSITKGKSGDEAKARALYEWIGTRIAYDYDKVKAYEERGEWREQNPETTFKTRKGVCIDYARLYAAMARAVGLDARVVTGAGYDGRGGYGAHAWNEVYLSEKGKWVPLDPTWARTGDWFNPPRFADTHIRQA